MVAACAGFAQLPVGRQVPVVRGPAGAFPLSAPQTLGRSVSSSAWAGGPSSLPYRVRLFQRTRTLLLSLRGKSGGAVVAFVAQQSLVSRKGGTWFTVREALRRGFAPGQSLFVVVVGASGFHAVSPGAVRHTFLLPNSQQLTFLPAPGAQAGESPKGIPGPCLNYSRSSAAGRRDPHGERYDKQSVAGPLTQAFWLGLCFRQ